MALDQDQTQGKTYRELGHLKKPAGYYQLAEEDTVGKDDLFGRLNKQYDHRDTLYFDEGLYPADDEDYTGMKVSECGGDNTLVFFRKEQQTSTEDSPEYAPLGDCSVPNGCRQLAYNEVIQAGDQYAQARVFYTGEATVHKGFRKVPKDSHGKTVKDTFCDEDIVVRIVDADAYVESILRLQKVNNDGLLIEQAEKLSKSFAKQVSELTTENLKLKNEVTTLTKEFEYIKGINSITPEKLEEKVQRAVNARVEAKLKSVEEEHQRALEDAKKQGAKEEYRRITGLNDNDLLRVILEYRTSKDDYGHPVYDVKDLIKLLVDYL